LYSPGKKSQTAIMFEISQLVSPLTYFDGCGTS
jgi:hypothetical protein